MKLWQDVQSDAKLLLSGSNALESYFAADHAFSGGGQQQSLLDLSDDIPGQVDSAGIQDIKRKIDELDERMGKVNKIKRERAEVLKDFKEKVFGEACRCETKMC